MAITPNKNAIEAAGLEYIEPTEIVRDTGPKALNLLAQAVVDLTESGAGIAGDIPIFATLAEAEAYEAANPGRTALTLEPSTPDTEAPKWPTGTALATDPADTSVKITATQAPTDDRGVVKWQASIDSGLTWQTVTASGRTVTVEGLSPATDYPPPRLRVFDAAGNMSPELVGSSGFSTDAEPPVPYTTVALSHEPLYYFPMGQADQKLNLGTLGADVGDFQVNEYSKGPALGGFADSAHFSWGQEYRLTGAYLRTIPTTWCMAVVVRLGPYSTANPEGLVGRYSTFVKFPNADLRLAGPSGQETLALEFGNSTLDENLPTINPTYQSAPLVLAQESDGSETRTYLNGAIIETAEASTWPSAGRYGIYPTSYRHAVEAVELDARGLYLDSKPLGDAGHAELAKSAGVM